MEDQGALITDRYLSARAAAQALGVTLPTLYAYVSRGLIRSEPGERQSRARRYHAEDVQRLTDRKTVRHDPTLAAANALDWGMPILDSSLTLIADGQLWYRGHVVTDLAHTATFESVAALLWTGKPDDASELFGAHWPPLATILDHLKDFHATLSLMQRMQMALTLAPTWDLAAFDREQPQRTGAHILQLLTAVVASTTKANHSIASTLSQAWCADHPAGEQLLNAALILCADHEMNVSAFAARVVASADAHLYHVVTAGLAALQGFRHGGYTTFALDFLRAIVIPEQARPAVAARLARGEGLPGFGHRLYPDGDPRATALLALIRATIPDAPVLALAEAVVAVADEATGKRPTIDLALAVLAVALDLPEGAALALFALGRTAGWIAHAIEQYRTEQLLRPRARYVGVVPIQDVGPSTYR